MSLDLSDESSSARYANVATLAVSESPAWTSSSSGSASSRAGLAASSASIARPLPMAEDETMPPGSSHDVRMNFSQQNNLDQQNFYLQQQLDQHNLHAHSQQNQQRRGYKQ
jgi:hypothetical protein